MSRADWLNEVILAAPDVDAKTFREVIAPEIVKASSRVTIYTSSTDRALQASKLLHQGARLELGGDDLVSFPDYPLIQVVDATGIDLGVTTLGHSTYEDELLTDINFALDGKAPTLRRLVRASGSSSVENSIDSQAEITNVDNSHRLSRSLTKRTKPQLLAEAHLLAIETPGTTVATIPSAFMHGNFETTL